MEKSEKSTSFLNWRKSDTGDSIAWGIILLWGAIIILGGTFEFGDKYEWWNPWGLFFIGIGIIGLAVSLIRLFVSSIQNPSLWDFIFGLFFLLMGMGNETGWIWAVALLVIGFSIIRSVAASPGRALIY